MTALIIILLVTGGLIWSLLVHTEHEFWGLFSLLLTAGGYMLVSGTETFVDLGHYIVQHPVATIIYALSYIAIGIVWSFFRFYSYVRGKKRSGISFESLSGADHTSKVMAWTANWPASVVGYIAGDWLYNLYHWVCSKVAGIYPRITKAVYGK